jgi:iron complex transport system substrate-binding protein
MTGEGTSVMGRTIVIVAIAAVCLVAGFAGGFALGAMIEQPQEHQPTKLYFIDDYDRNVTLDSYPERIVSIAPTPTEMLFAVGAGDLVVGVDGYSDYPSATQNITKVGDYQLNLEQIVTLKPDLILSGDLVPQADLDQLDTNGIPYMIIADRNIEDVFGSIMLVGNVTNHTSDATSLVADLRARVTAVTNITLASNVTHPKVYLEYFSYYTFGPGSFGDDLIKLAGGTNIAASKGEEYPVVTDEFVVNQNPDIIVYTSGPYMVNVESEIISRPGWNDTNAVIDMNIQSVDDNLISRYGPRIVDGLEQLAAIIHPELF